MGRQRGQRAQHGEGLFGASVPILGGRSLHPVKNKGGEFC